MNLQELKKQTPSELISQAEKLGIENPSTLRKQEILFSILKKLAEKNEQITGGGVLEVLQDGFAIRRVAAEKGVPCFTSIDTARAVAESNNRPNDYYNILPIEKYLGL